MKYVLKTESGKNKSYNPVRNKIIRNIDAMIDFVGSDERFKADDEFVICNMIHEKARIPLILQSGII